MSRLNYGSNSSRCFRRKALGTIVSTAIIMSSVSVIGIFTLGWSNSNLLTQKTEIEELFNVRINKMNEDILFENIIFQTLPSRHLNVTISNVGIIGLNVTELQLQNPSTLAELASFSYSDGGIVPSGTFSKNATYNWSSSEEINVIATTERGSQFVTQVVAP